MQRVANECAAKVAEVERAREEAEKSLARLVEHSDLDKAHHEAMTSQLVSRIDALESDGGVARGSPAPSEFAYAAVQARQQLTLALYRRTRWCFIS